MTWKRVQETAAGYIPGETTRLLEETTRFFRRCESVGIDPWRSARRPSPRPSRSVERATEAFTRAVAVRDLMRRVEAKMDLDAVLPPEFVSDLDIRGLASLRGDARSDFLRAKLRAAGAAGRRDPAASYAAFLRTVVNV